MYELITGSYELSEKAKQQKFQCKINLTSVDVETIVVSALEGGIGYWSALDNTTPDWESKPNELPTSQYATQLLLENKRIRLIEEESENNSFELTLRKLLNGIEQYVSHGKSLDVCDIDSEAADMIFQYALFGEIVYS
jgi:hypothetical protein